MSVAIEVWGDYACFSRPEMKVERVSYDVMTPSAARGLIEAIYWHPGLKWIIDRIHVCAPIRFTNIRRNEVKDTISARKVKTAMEKYEAKADELEEKTGKCYDSYRQAACYLRCDADEDEAEYNKNHSKKSLVKTKNL